MAGFLAPTITETGSQARAVGASGDTSVGDALSGIGGLLDLIGKGPRGGSTVTQKDRDNASLRPFLARVNRLEGQRDKLGPARFKSMLNAEFVGFAVGNGTLIPQAREGVLGITGVEIGGEEFDLINEQQEGVERFLETSRGQAVLPAIMAAAVNPVTGEFDNDLGFALLSEEAALTAAEDAKLDGLKRIAEAELAAGQINEQRLKGVVDDQALFYGNMALKDVVAFSALAVQAETTVSGSQPILASLRQRKLLLGNEVMAAARRGGYANHPDFNVETSLQAYTDTIEMVEALGDDAIQTFEVLKAQSGATTIRVINSVVGFGGENREFQSYALGVLLDRESANLENLVTFMNPTRLREFTNDQPLFTGTSTPVTPDSPPSPVSVIAPDVVTTARGMNDFERAEEVIIGTATFGAFVPNHLESDRNRAVAVDSFTASAAAMNTSTRPVAEETFDTVYDRKFFSTYEAITRTGDTVAANLQNVVAENLSTVFNQRRDLAATRIRNGFAETFPSISLQFNGTEVFIDLGEPKTTNERFLRDTLKRQGLPHTFEGAKQLAILEPNNPIFLPFSEARGINDIRSDVAYANKVLSTVNRLPDLATHINSRVEKEFGFGDIQNNVTTTEATKVFRVTKPEDVEALNKGDTWEFIDEDGDVHRGVL